MLITLKLEGRKVIEELYICCSRPGLGDIE